MKKIIRILIVAVVMIIVSNHYYVAEASDEYFGNDVYGREVYIVTDSIKETMTVTRNGYFEGYRYDCTVKIVFADSREYFCDEYSFFANHAFPYWIKNGVRASRQEVFQNNKAGGIESRLLWHFCAYSENAHPNQWKSERVLEQ